MHQRAIISGLVLAGMLGTLAVTRSGAQTPHPQGATPMADAAHPDPKTGEQCAFPTSDAELRKLLTPEQYRITKQNGTERPFANAFWNHHEPGLYVDIISGEALFASTHKFDSGTGWPSFVQPIAKDAVVEKTDSSHGMTRVEVRSKASDAHLGHVFDDGPGPTGQRYCINSAALRFIPVKDLEREGYGKYLELFKSTP